MMVKYYLLLYIVVIFCSVFLCRQATAQVNLVPNPSFEDSIACPTMFGDINLANYWSSYNASPDYLHSCNVNGIGVPSNIAGFQYAYNGNAYAQIITFDSQSSWIYRELIGVQLVSPILAGVKYYISFYYSRAYSYYWTGSTNNLGFRFTNQPYSGSNPMPIDNFSHGKIDSICYDTTNWSRAFFEFQSDTTFEYLVIGNFYNNLLTDTFGFHTNSAGYFIDAVCVSTDSLCASNWTSIPEVKSTEVKLYPSPANDYVTISNIYNFNNLEIYTSYGRLCARKNLTSGSNIISVLDLASGIYFINIDKKHLFKLFINH